MGVQRPRVLHLPSGICSTAGSEAIDLAESCGLVLDDWQRDVILGAMAKRADGKWAAKQVGLVVPRQNGKGGILECRQLWGLYMNKRDRLQTMTAHRFDTCLDHFRRVVTLIEDTPELLALVKDFCPPIGMKSDGAPMRRPFCQMPQSIIEVIPSGFR